MNDKDAGKTVGQKVRKYLLAGFLVVAPTFITLYIFFGLLRITDRWAKSMLPRSWYDGTLILGVPGMGLLLLLALLLAIGFFASGWFGRFLVSLADNIFTNTPVLSSLYSTLKNLLHTLLGENTTSFRQVVYVEFPRPGSWSIGFVTSAVMHDIDLLPEDSVSVFVPTTPNPTSGFLVMVARKDVRISSMSVEEALKMVVSLGMTR